MTRRCGTCWSRCGRGSGRWCSRSTPLPIRGRGRPLARAGSGIITPAPVITAATGRRWRGGRSSGWPSCRSPRIRGPRRRTRCGPGAGDDATRQAARQIMAHSARLRADGGDGIPLYVLDAGYDEAPLTWDLREHLEKVQVLVRLRNDRVLYRDPPPRVPGKARPARKHGSGTDRFECENPATWGGPDQELSRHDERYGQVSVMSWSGLHPKLFCRGRFAGFAAPPGDQMPPDPRHRHPPAERPRRARAAVAVVGRAGQPGPGPVLARLPAPVRHRAHLPAG